MKLQRFSFILFIAISILFSCSDPAEIGAGLLEEDRVDLLFSDEVPIKAITVEGTPIQTFNFDSRIPTLNRVIFGEFADPLFGTTNASIYTQASLGSQDPPSLLLQRGGESFFDSVVLSLAYDTLGGYGNTGQTYGIEVFVLEEKLLNTENHLSNQTFLAGNEAIGSLEFVPDFVTRPVIIDYTGDIDTISTDPHVRVHLDPLAVSNIIADTANLEDNLDFQNAFNGLHIRPAAPTAGLIPFDFGNRITRITLYFKENGENREFQLLLNRPVDNLKTARVSSLLHNYDGATAQPSAANATQDTLIFLQGLAGLNAQILFPDVSDFRDIVVNKAELEFTVANFDTTDFALPNQLIASQLNSTEQQILTDVSAAIFAQRLNPSVLGGFPTEVAATNSSVTLVKYNLNISRFFQEVVESSEETGFTLSIGAQRPERFSELPAKPSDPSRVVFFGPNHSLYPLKLNLTYTKL